jgi:hypothetical protein
VGGHPSDRERISIVRGPTFSIRPGAEADPRLALDGKDPERDAFARRMNTLNEELAALVPLAEEGRPLSLPVNPPVNLNADLQADHLVGAKELIAIAADLGAPFPVAPRLDAGAEQVQIVSAPSAIAHNHLADRRDDRSERPPLARRFAHVIHEHRFEGTVFRKTDVFGVPVDVAHPVATSLETVDDQPLPEFLPQDPSIRTAEVPSHAVNSRWDSPLAQELAARGILDQDGYVVPTFPKGADLSFLGDRAQGVASDLLRSRGAAVLFRNVSPSNARVIAAKNAPGTFVFDNGDESFLVSAPGVRSIDEGLVVLPTRPDGAAHSPVRLAYGGTTQGEPFDFFLDVARLGTGVAERLSRALLARGLEGVLTLESQQAPAVTKMNFGRFEPAGVELPPLLDGAEVDFDGPQGGYFWEVFFHVPMLVAGALSANRQFAEAERWFRYVLDPTAAVPSVGPTTFSDAAGELVAPDVSAQWFERLRSAVTLDGRPTPVESPAAPPPAEVPPTPTSTDQALVDGTATMVNQLKDVTEAIDDAIKAFRGPFG